MINELKELYEAYKAKAAEVRKKAPLFAGFLGLGSDPRKHPCHEEFYDAVTQWTDRFVKSEDAPRQAMEAASYMLEQPDQNRETDAYWFLFVMVGCIRSMIPLLSREDCKTLVERFDSLYPKRERMPIHVDTYKQLVKAAK